MNVTPNEEKIYRYWWFHDGAWYQNVARTFGFAAANQLNKEALRYMAKRAMQTYIREQNVDVAAIQDIERLVHHFMEGAYEMWPRHWVHLEANILGPDTFEVINYRNFAIDMLRKAGTLEHYECPGLILREGWFAGLGIKDYTQEETECVVRGDPVCRYRAQVRIAGER